MTHTIINAVLKTSLNQQRINQLLKRFWLEISVLFINENSCKEINRVGCQRRELTLEMHCETNQNVLMKAIKADSICDMLAATQFQSPMCKPKY